MIIESNIKLLPYYQTDFPVKSHSPRTGSIGQTTPPKIFQGERVHQPPTPLANRIKTAMWLKEPKIYIPMAPGEALKFDRCIPSVS